MKLLTAFLALFVFAAHGVCQSQAELERELRRMESAAKRDPAKLLAAAEWAAAQGLREDAERIYQQVLELDPENRSAHEALGHEQLDGQWMTAEAAAKARQKAREDEFRARGMVEVDGIWVEKEHVDDARRGVFHHDGQVVSQSEYAALMSGMVRHPVTGRIIAAEDRDKAGQRQFPIGDEGRWVGEEEADRYHADPEHPWLYRTHYATLMSTLPIAKLEEIGHYADRGVELVRPVLGFTEPLPAYRPTILVAATEDLFRAYGNDIGDETSAYGAFLADDRVRLRIPGQGAVRPAVCLWHKDWGPYYLRHAAAMARAHGAAAAVGAELPLWLLEGFGGLASRFDNAATAGWFGQQHAQKGGVRDVGDWLGSFSINPGMESKDIDYNIYQAGLVVSFAMAGGDDEVTAAMQQLTEAIQSDDARAVSRAVVKLEKVLAGKEDGLKAYLQDVIRKGS